MSNVTKLVGGQEVYNVHPAASCGGPPCCIHNPSDHHMKEWTQRWRDDRGIMERVCSHGVGHPDPDDLRVQTGADSGVHGCDGCCRPDSEEA